MPNGIDPDHLYACTDCGLVPRSREAAAGKLRALAAGAAIVRAEIERGGSPSA